MATPVRQGGSFTARARSGDSGIGFLYVEMQNSGKAGPPHCRIPHTAMTLRALNQTQQRNVVRQYMGLPPIDTRLQHAGRQAGMAAYRLLQAADHALAEMASQAAAGWRSLPAFYAAALLKTLPELHIGLPGAAAHPGDPLPPEPKPAACKNALLDALDWEKAYPNMSTVDELLAACPGVRCHADTSSELQNATVVIESAEQIRKLAIGLAGRGATVFLSAGAMDALGNQSSCLDDWFGSAYTQLETMTPGDWAPASGGSVVLLSSREFAAALPSLRPPAHPGCTADALACQPAPQPVPAPMRSRRDGQTGGETGPFLSAVVGIVAVGGLCSVAGIVFGVIQLIRTTCDSTPSASVGPAPPPATGAGGNVAPPFTPPLPPSMPAGMHPAVASGSSVVTAIPVQLQPHTPTYDHTHPPAGLPGGD